MAFIEMIPRQSQYLKYLQLGHDREGPCTVHSKSVPPYIERMPLSPQEPRPPFYRQPGASFLVLRHPCSNDVSSARSPESKRLKGAGNREEAHAIELFGHQRPPLLLPLDSTLDTYFLVITIPPSDTVEHTLGCVPLSVMNRPWWSLSQHGTRSPFFVPSSPGSRTSHL